MVRRCSIHPGLMRPWFPLPFRIGDDHTKLEIGECLGFARQFAFTLGPAFFLVALHQKCCDRARRGILALFTQLLCRSLDLGRSMLRELRQPRPRCLRNAEIAAPTTKRFPRAGTSFAASRPASFLHLLDLFANANTGSEYGIFGSSLHLLDMVEQNLKRRRFFDDATNFIIGLCCSQLPLHRSQRFKRLWYCWNLLAQRNL